MCGIPTSWSKPYIHADGDDCTVCNVHSEHLERAQIATASYHQDTERQHNDVEVVVSCDMQKVIMLPRLPGIMNSCFTSRLVQFHDTFALLGGKKKDGNLMGLLWDESVSGRNTDDVASTLSWFIYFLIL